MPKMIFSNDIFLKSIQLKITELSDSIDAFKLKKQKIDKNVNFIQKYEEANVFDCAIKSISQIECDKDFIYFFINLFKIKLINKIVLDTIKFKISFQEFTDASSVNLRRLFNYLELITFNEDLSDNAEKSSLVINLKYSMKNIDGELDAFKEYLEKLNPLLIDTHLKLLDYFNRYFGKQKKTLISLLNLREHKIKLIKIELNSLKDCASIKQEIIKLEHELMSKCKETVEKSDLIELILFNENHCLYFAFHLLNELTNCLNEIHLKITSLKTTISIVEAQTSTSSSLNTSTNSTYTLIDTSINQTSLNNTADTIVEMNKSMQNKKQSKRTNKQTSSNESSNESLNNSSSNSFINRLDFMTKSTNSTIKAESNKSTQRGDLMTNLSTSNFFYKSTNRQTPTKSLITKSSISRPILKSTVKMNRKDRVNVRNFKLSNFSSQHKRSEYVREKEQHLNQIDAINKLLPKIKIKEQPPSKPSRSQLKKQDLNNNEQIASTSTQFNPDYQMAYFKLNNKFDRKQSSNYSSNVWKTFEKNSLKEYD